MSETRVRRMAAEAVVIVGSILLAFALDAWWDDRSERARVDEVLDAVGTEFEAEVAALDSIIAVNGRRVAAQRDIVLRTRPANSQLSEDSIQILAATFPDSELYDPGFGALSTLLSSGGLEQVDDPGIRAVLAGWPAELADLDWERKQYYDGVQRVFVRLAEIDGFVRTVEAAGPVWEQRISAMQRDELARNLEASLAITLEAYSGELVRVRNRAADVASSVRAR